jgi:hypothetical protein
VIAGRDCAVTLSRGALREGFAALEAFGDLLGSRRVGPRALERARVETLEACEALVAALGPFQHTLVVALGKDDETEAVMHALCERLKSHVSSISSSLADRAVLSARRRLALEALFRKHRAEFRDNVALSDVAVAAATAAPVEVDLVDLLEQRHGERAPEGPVVRVDIDSTRPVMIRADRHVLAGLVEAAASFVCRAGASEARLVAGINDDGAFVVRIGPVLREGSSAKRTITLPLRGEVDLAVQVARLVGPRSGLGVSFDSATNAVSIVPNSRAATC